jgi:NAD+ diphosphatase
MIHEIFPHRFNNHFVAATTMGDNDIVLHYQNNTLLVKAIDDKAELPRKKDFPLLPADAKTAFLGTIDEDSCFLLFDCPITTTEGYDYKEIRFFRSYGHKGHAWMAIVGLQVMNWYLKNRYCGACGTPTIEKSDERAIVCPECKTVVYPNISPAIIVAITCNDKLLLARNAGFTENWYSLIAGFADIGESLEETVRREVKEEVGLDVTNIRYYKSQPWPFSGSMMIGFIAEADDTQPVCCDAVEITEAAWFKRGQLPNHPPTISIGGEMIERFDRGEL